MPRIFDKRKPIDKIGGATIWEIPPMRKGMEREMRAHVVVVVVASTSWNLDS